MVKDAAFHHFTIRLKQPAQGATGYPVEEWVTYITTAVDSANF